MFAPPKLSDKPEEERRKALDKEMRKADALLRRIYARQIARKEQEAKKEAA